MVDKKRKAIAYWIFLGIAMLIIQVIIGGITRLTGSGLSITEWKPIMGALPPLSETEWQTVFNEYQKIAQYKYLNQHFVLSDFKFIFFWEWFHRLWARLIGFVFLIPFIYFIVKKHFSNWMIIPLSVLFLLGALQGTIGWIMVKSGLNETDLYVSHIRLAVHFISAMVLISYALVFYLKISLSANSYINQPNISRGLVFIVIVVSIQLVYGAFMAGLKAAPIATTFPDINGSFFPEYSITKGGFLHNIIYNKLIVHFIHRTLAYAIAIFIGIWWWKAKNISFSIPFNRARSIIVLLVFVQIFLGIFTLINGGSMNAGKFGVYEWLALFHQITGMLLLLSLVSAIYISGRTSVVMK